MTLNEVIEHHMGVEFDIKEDIKHPEYFNIDPNNTEDITVLTKTLKDNLEYTQLALAALEEKRDREAVEPCDACEATYYQYDCEESYESGRAFYSVKCKYCPICGRLLKK